MYGEVHTTALARVATYRPMLPDYSTCLYKPDILAI